MGALSLLTSCVSEKQTPQLVGLYNTSNVIASGIEQRIPFAVIDETNTAELISDEAELPVTIISSSGETVAEVTVKGHVVEHDHLESEKDEDHQHANLYRYFPLRAKLPTPGVYDVEVDFSGVKSSLTVQAFEPTTVSVPLPGSNFPEVATPTILENSGVDRLCTKSPICNFHEVSADQLLQQNKPFILLVATPAFCSTAYCGPVLDTLIEVSTDYPGLDVIHCEVYANSKEVDGNYADPAIKLAPAVEAMGLTYEPALFLVDPKGIVVDRIDNVFDKTELSKLLTGFTQN